MHKKITNFFYQKNLPERSRRSMEFRNSSKRWIYLVLKGGEDRVHERPLSAGRFVTSARKRTALATY